MLAAGERQKKKKKTAIVSATFTYRSLTYKKYIKENSWMHPMLITYFNSPTRILNRCRPFVLENIAFKSVHYYTVILY